jgi:phosphate acyltransferase
MEKKTLKTPFFSIGVDLMGGETSPEELLEKISSHFNSQKDFKLCFLGPSSLASHLPLSPSLSWVTADDYISLEENPLVAIRHKKKASLVIGMKLVAEGKLDGFVSSGNTGALLALARRYCPLLPEIQRPALMVLLPTRKKPVAILDVGANLSLQPDHFIQFAKIGIAYQKSRGIENPTLGLLNIGAEEKKGTPDRRQAYLKLQELNSISTHPLFLGNVEAKDIFKGVVDVLVTDGFSGNIFLKTAEGLGAHILEILREAIGKEPLFKPLLSLGHQWDWEKYPGAILAGIEKLVVKCHSYGGAHSFIHSLHQMNLLLHSQFIDRLKQSLS